MRKKHASSLRSLREVVGLNQQDFASAVGTTKAIIENVEMGRSPMAIQLKEKIVAYTGVRPDSLAKTIPLDFRDNPYSARSWKAWREATYSGEDANKLVQLASEYIRVLLACAYETPSGTKTTHLFRMLLLEFNQWIFEKVERNNLYWVIERRTLDDEILTKRQTGTTTVEKARSHFGHLLEWQENEDPKWSPDTVVSYTQISFPLFVPFVGFAEIGGKTAFINGDTRWRHIFNLQVAEKCFRLSDDRNKMTATIVGMPETDEGETLIVKVPPSPPSKPRTAQTSRAGRSRPNTPAKGRKPRRTEST